jgi:hypothetical protein
MEIPCVVSESKHKQRLRIPPPPLFVHFVNFELRTIRNVEITSLKENRQISENMKAGIFFPHIDSVWLKLRRIKRDSILQILRSKKIWFLTVLIDDK